MGPISIGAQSVGVTAPCAEDDRSTQSPPTSTTYTTAPFTSARTLAGPISATVYASATTTDTEWVVEVEDVAPDGSSRPLTEGALLGSLRSVDNALSWVSPDGAFLLPYHPYTQASAKPVTPGQVTRYDIEVFPTFDTIVAGHSLRVTISSVDTPHLQPIPSQVANLVGGVYQIQRSPRAPSAVEVSFLPAP